MTLFQPMPDLTEDQYDALRDDIAKNGVIVPIVLDQRGRLLDGHNRRKIAAELGLECPSEVRQVPDDDAAMELAVTLNCARRHLSREQVRLVIRGEIDRRPSDSDRSIARRVGCSPSTVGAVRREGDEPEVIGEQITREEAERSTHDLRESVEQARGALFALVGMALEHGVSVTEVVGALTMARLRYARREHASADSQQFFLEAVYDFVIEAATWEETRDQFPVKADVHPAHEHRAMLLDAIVSMGDQEHPADSVRTGDER